MSKYKCTVSGCKGLHHSLLHDSDELCSAVKNHTVEERERGIETNSNPTRFEDQPEVAALTYGNKCVLLNTFMIFVKSADGYRIKLRGLLDNASTIRVMREDIARKLGFKFSNRVAEIQTLSKDCHWKHVSSKNNPADLISRGCDVDELLKNEMWFSGPDLQTDEYENNQLFPDPSYRDELKCAQRNKWQFEKNNVAVGCLVLLKENDLPPCKWAMARIWEVMELTVSDLIAELESFDGVKGLLYANDLVLWTETPKYHAKEKSEMAWEVIQPGFSDTSKCAKQSEYHSYVAVLNVLTSDYVTQLEQHKII
ncbi:uncharacterized protein TNCV_1879221 [Trichonephila clavipes]|nr:uncharacterized protein TNCV_1879221 [Trichonephila clavipes]